MKYPSLLLQKKRKKLDTNKIKNWNYLYSRHKPSSNWNHEEGLPDFTKIKIDQSFNWCNYTIPLWTRFNLEKEYLQEYAVAGIKVKTIREEHTKLDCFDQKIIDIIHDPIDINYSHCQLNTFQTLNRIDRRQLRATFRHKCKVPLKPNEKRYKLLQYFDIIIMYLRRILSFIYK